MVANMKTLDQIADKMESDMEKLKHYFISNGYNVDESIAICLNFSLRMLNKGIESAKSAGHELPELVMEFMGPLAETSVNLMLGSAATTTEEYQQLFDQFLKKMVDSD